MMPSVTRQPPALANVWADLLACSNSASLFTEKTDRISHIRSVFRILQGLVVFQFLMMNESSSIFMKIGKNLL